MKKNRIKGNFRNKWKTNLGYKFVLRIFFLNIIFFEYVYEKN